MDQLSQFYNEPFYGMAMSSRDENTGPMLINVQRNVDIAAPSDH